ncbi:MAG: chromate transporter [Erysipelotrichaceae bacterium]|nr:chromate transporter [Erysipelotrichaceae bacterium]
MNILLELFLIFAKISLFTFGGGYAMIAMIEHNCVEKKKWITHDELMDITVIAESTPGPIAINCATYTGYKVGGLIGSISSTLGIVLPSFIVIYLISMFLDNFLEFTIISNAFKGIKIGGGILILSASITMIRKMKKGIMSRVIMICSCISMLCINILALDFSSISLMLIAGVISLVVYILQIEMVKVGVTK